MQYPNFLQPRDPRFFKPLSVARTVLVFGVSFVALFFIFNFPSILSSVGSNFESEEAKNERITAMYRELYGYQSHPEMVNQAIASTPVVTSVPVTQYNNDRPQSGVAHAQDSLGDVLLIPKLNVQTPIVIGASADASRILGDLEHGAVLYPGSAVPGKGMSVIIGHSSSDNPWAKYGKIFSGLGKLTPGDIIVIKHEGKDLTYVVNDKKTGSADKLGQAGVSGDLVLATCWPIGTDKERILITAQLTK